MQVVIIPPSQAERDKAADEDKPEPKSKRVVVRGPLYNFTIAATVGAILGVTIGIVGTLFGGRR